MAIRVKTYACLQASAEVYGKAKDCRAVSIKKYAKRALTNGIGDLAEPLTPVCMSICQE
jgi:hypothetical protein